MVDLGTPDRAAALSAVYAPPRSAIAGECISCTRFVHPLSFGFWGLGPAQPTAGRSRAWPPPWHGDLGYEPERRRRRDDDAGGHRLDGAGDGIKLSVQPRYLLASPAKRQLGIQYTPPDYAPAAPTSFNTFAGILTPLFDANLSGNPWYLIADPSVLPAFVYGSLESEPGPRVATRAGFESEGLEMRVTFDFGITALEWRTAYRNLGA